MSITTKKGDKGMTSLFWGGQVSKDNIRVEAYGTLDELCSFLGFSRSLIKDRKTNNLIKAIQQELFIVGAEIACESKFIAKLERTIGKSHTDRLEKVIRELEEKATFKECCFYIPGENLIAGALDIARTVARRAERRVVALKVKKMLANPAIIVYLNRLSDLLYLLARSFEKKHTGLSAAGEISPAFAGGKLR